MEDHYDLMFEMDWLYDDEYPHFKKYLVDTFGDKIKHHESFILLANQYSEAFKMCKGKWDIGEIKNEDLPRFKDLHEISLNEWHDESFSFENNFYFIGDDNKKYLFDVEHYQDLVEEYGREHLTEAITVSNGSFKGLVERRIAVLVK